MKKKIILVLVLSLVIVGMGAAIYLLNNKVYQKSQQIIAMEKVSKNADKKYRKLKNTNDSLALINSFLARYRTLTVAMSYRDSVRMPLKYNIGDVVHLKRDSSRVIISDIIVGGGKHEYYIKYKVMFKNGSEEEVVPEFIY